MERREFLGSLAAAVAGSGLSGASLAAESPSAIPKRALGKTGVEVTCLGLGGAIGMERPPSEGNAAEMANAAIDLGIRYFDTAPAYGRGQSEKNLGEVMAARRKEVFLATKTIERRYDAAMRSIDESLKRLRTGHVDLIQIHGVGIRENLAQFGRPDGVYTALLKLRDQKVCRFIGMTCHDDADLAVRALGMYDFDTVLTTFNPTLKRRPFVERVPPAAKARNMGVIAMKVMGGQLGSLAKGNPPKNDPAANFDDAPQQADAAMLLRYVLGLGISVAIIGVKSLEQIKENVRAVSETAPLNEAERKELEKRMS